MVAGRNPQERLFAELSAEGDGDKFGDALGKKFARVIDHTGIVVMRKNSTESDGGYHPLRHRFITDLLGAGVREGIVDYLSGHASGARERERERSLDGERERYTEDPPVKELQQAIDRLPVSVDSQSGLMPGYVAVGEKSSATEADFGVEHTHHSHLPYCAVNWC